MIIAEIRTISSPTFCCHSQKNIAPTLMCPMNFAIRGASGSNYQASARWKLKVEGLDHFHQAKTENI
ncbi:Hypothetical protein P9303_14751 [Prochlorococcus marinus str. MIT 9303]|uniref:Uncharacterized protein n=1 Tax=Prochlorococcus marinus (strain MIT 9303) TaxID=59922 RepID=A2C9R1_PROM3|nr:Hypothetical protein P9303_14751 [Prochlorococcus marinus str. MIT 9303]